MDCGEVRQQLNQLVDLELDAPTRQELLNHCGNCSACDRLYSEITQLKRLVHAKVRRPAAPAGLANLVRRRLSASGGRLGRRTVIAAAALVALSVTTVALFVAFSTSTERLAHAKMVRCCLDEFLRVMEDAARDIEENDGGPRGGSVAPVAADVALEEIYERTRMQLDALPEIDGGTFHRSEPCSFETSDGEAIKGVRLDYRVVDDERKLEYPVCIFVFPLECLDCPGHVLEKMANGKLCKCAGKTDKTIYCFRSTQHVYNLVTTLDPSAVAGSYRPRLR